VNVGQHLLADLKGIDAALLRDAASLEALLRRAAHEAGARVLGSHFHSFGAGNGITGVVLLAESHMSIHTWPEAGLAIVDVFMCGSADPRRALGAMLDELSPTERDVRVVARGGPAARVYAAAGAK
jgi:S-adenosylmethionine decarboxylase